MNDSSTSGSTAIADGRWQMAERAERCAICGAPLISAVESSVCAHCAGDARAEIEVVSAHFRTPAGELARLNPIFLRRVL